MSDRRRRAPFTGIALVALAVALLSGACSLRRSGYQFVRNRPTGTYLKLPDDWKVYSDESVDKLLAEANPEGVDRTRLPFISLFRADRTMAEPGLDLYASDPVGIVRVRTLTEAERDGISSATARDDVLDVNGSIQAAGVPPKKAVHVKQEFAQGDRFVFTYKDEELGLVSTVDQTTLLDRDRNRLYVLIIACDPRCYEQHRKEIETVVTSLTIKET
jgi:hypothetical protein